MALPHPQWPFNNNIIKYTVYLGVQTPARPPPHAARRPHAYKWREDSRLGVRPRRTGVLAMHACPARLT
ncbi:hypothetical protein PCASD_15684 [Puccinia coronata f. sp. avenae]|uniref:Uncharacterized protein n=1 Tax=Puccinia coronata f. sp. avenae TaxID=200324 RepID=A0A2N5UDH4_9BASI|nr:hypothetical protein PCASD_15684 [Puccinia coronata f. sp. avenae]